MRTQGVALGWYSTRLWRWDRAAGCAYSETELEAGWIFAGYVEVLFEGKAGSGDGAFVEEAADEGDAVGDATGWVELWERVVGVGGPVAAGLGDLDEAGAEGEGGVAGEVGDGEHLVAEGGD